jgi:hypothetical protein
MMKKTRRKIDEALKAKIAYAWKKQLQEQAARAFDGVTRRFVQNSTLTIFRLMIAF